MSILFSPFTGLVEFEVPILENLFLTSLQPVLGGDIADGAVETDGVIMFNEASDDPPGVLHGQRCLRAQAILLERGEPAFLFAVALGIVRGGAHMGEAGLADELLEVLDDERGAVVGDDPRVPPRMFFQGPLEDQLHVSLRHVLGDLPVDQIPAAPVQHAAQVIEGAADIQVGDVDVPVFMGSQRLHESGALVRDFFTKARWIRPASLSTR